MNNTYHRRVVAATARARRPAARIAHERARGEPLSAGARRVAKALTMTGRMCSSLESSACAILVFLADSYVRDIGSILDWCMKGVF